jgi:hypothetical protein
MKSFLLIMAQLGLVTLVYVFAYRAGYRSAHSKAVSVVKKIADPGACLLDSLSETVDETVTDREGKGELTRVSNPSKADRHHPFDIES